MYEIDYRELLVDAADLISIVTDAKTHELLYMNKAALQSYKLSQEQEYQGKQCYEVLQGRSTPCEECPIKRMTEGEMYRWEQLNHRTGRWHDNNDYIVSRNGRTLYVKCGRDMTARHEGRLSDSGDLSMEDTLFRCLYVMAKEKDFNVAVQLFLEAVGRYHAADRCYIFEFDLEQQILNNTFEWCNEGVRAEIENLKNIPLEVVRDWIYKFEHTGEFSITAIDCDVAPNTEEYRILAAQGIESLMAAPLQQEDQKIVGFLGVDNPRRHRGNMQLIRATAAFIQAEFERRQMHKELEHLSYTDVLTGAYNRRQYDQYLKEKGSEVKDGLGAVATSINGMKDINTLYGTDYGDKVICHVCETLRKKVPGKLFRVSGDEFVVFCDGITRSGFQAVISEFRTCMLHQEMCYVSIGCAWQNGEVIAEKLVEKAEEQMYAEKRNYYGSVLKSGKHQGHKGAEEEVLEEIANHRFVAFFQPKIDFARGQITGAEALVRKLDEEGALIYPDKFIPYYEAAGLIRYVDLHVLELACAALQSWEKEGIDLQIAVNFSRLTLMETAIVDEILSVCRNYGISPSKITIEVTENISKMEQMRLQELITQLKENQFHISLDDFGSSYSNLSILSTIDFDEVKFDRTLIHDIESNTKSQVVVRNGLKMCEELDGAVTVAEGIETKEQMDLLIRYGCYMGQGYYFSKPISNAAFTALLKEKNTYCAPKSESEDVLLSEDR